MEFARTGTPGAAGVGHICSKLKKLSALLEWNACKCAEVKSNLSLDESLTDDLPHCETKWTNKTDKQNKSTFMVGLGVRHVWHHGLLAAAPPAFRAAASLPWEPADRIQNVQLPILLYRFIESGKFSHVATLGRDIQLVSHFELGRAWKSATFVC